MIRQIVCGTWPDKSLKAIREKRDEYRTSVNNGGDPLDRNLAACCGSCRMFEKNVLPLIGAQAVEDKRKGHVTAVTDALLARGVTRMAKMIFSLIRQMFRFAVDRDIIEAEPTAAIRKAKIGGKDVEPTPVIDESIAIPYYYSPGPARR